MGTIAISTFISDVRRIIGEPVILASPPDPNQGTNWINSEILEYLNKGKNDLCRILKNTRQDYLVVTNQALNLNSTTKEYAMPSGFRELVGIKCVTAGMEDIRFRKVSMATEEWQDRDSVPQSNGTVNLDELIYTIVGDSTLKLADYPPTALTINLDFFSMLADMAIGDASVDLQDELREYMEYYAAMLALQKIPKDDRYVAIAKDLSRRESNVVNWISVRQTRDPEFVETYDPE